MVTMKLRAPTINITPRPTSVEADTHNRMIGMNANLSVGEKMETMTDSEGDRRRQREREKEREREERGR